MNIRPLIALSILLAGCGADLEEACNDYVEAASSCVLEAYGEDQEAIDSALAAYDDVCAVYDGINDQATENYLGCLTDAYRTGDCSTPEALEATTDEANECVYAY